MKDEEDLLGWGRTNKLIRESVEEIMILSISHKRLHLDSPIYAKLTLNTNL